MNHRRSNHPNRWGHRVFVRSAPAQMSRGVNGSAFARDSASGDPTSSAAGWLSSPPGLSISRSTRKLRPACFCAQTITASTVGVGTPASSATPRITAKPYPTSSAMYRCEKSGTRRDPFFSFEGKGTSSLSFDDAALSEALAGRMGWVRPRYAGFVRIMVAVEVLSSAGSSPYESMNHARTGRALDMSSTSAPGGYRALIAAVTAAISEDIASHARSSGAVSYRSGGGPSTGVPSQSRHLCHSSVGCQNALMFESVIPRKPEARRSAGTGPTAICSVWSAGSAYASRFLEVPGNTATAASTLSFVPRTSATAPGCATRHAQGSVSKPATTTSRSTPASASAALAAMSKPPCATAAARIVGRRAGASGNCDAYLASASADWRRYGASC